MKLKNIPVEELELMSYTDIAYMVLKESKEAMNTPKVFKLISELLEYTDEEYASKIGDFYTSLNLDKRFVLLENNCWDLREKHAVAIVVEDDEEEAEIEIEDDIEEEVEDIDSEIDEDDVELDDADDDIDDLSIVNEEDIIE